MGVTMFQLQKGEGLPLAVLQAMSMGLNCVLTDVSGHCDLIDHGRNGYLIKTSDYYLNEILDTITSLENDASLRVLIGNQARSTVIKKFTQVTHFDAVAASYENSC